MMRAMLIIPLSLLGLIASQAEAQHTPAPRGVDSKWTGISHTTLAPSPNFEIPTSTRVLHSQNSTRNSRNRGHHARSHHRNVVYAYHSPRCYFVDGGYEVVNREFWVPEYWATRYEPPEYEERLFRGRWARVLVRKGGYRKYLVEGHYETEEVSTKFPGRWVCNHY